MKMSRKWENKSVNISINIIKINMVCWNKATGKIINHKKEERVQFTFSDHNRINLNLIIKAQQRAPLI
jgi:hypothetical protein